jgi:hypothetical protein
MKTIKLIVPILNKSVTTFRGPTWFLTNEVSIESLSAEEFGILRGSPLLEYHNLIKPNSKCVQFHQQSLPIDKDAIFNELSKVSFLLNYFSLSNPIALSFVAVLVKKRKNKLESIFDLPLIVDSRFSKNNSYSLVKNTNRNEISDFYKVIKKVCDENKPIYLTFSRFNSALSKSEMVDKIIDLTISLESLIGGTTELRNRFSLHLSWIAENDVKKREETFKLLGQLYDARSRIVHGSSNDLNDKKIKPVIERWNDLIKISKAILGYYILYLYNSNIEDWYNHQKLLTLGIQKRFLE